MPPEGFKSITVSEELYKKIYSKYEKDLEKFKEKGIFSFGGYVTQVLLDTEDRNHFEDIKELLAVNNSLLIGMFDLMLGGDKETAQFNLMNLKMTMCEFIKQWKEGQDCKK